MKALRKSTMTMFALIAMIWLMGGKALQAQEKSIKVGEFNYSQYNRIEDRVFFLYEMQAKGYEIEASAKDGIVDFLITPENERSLCDNDIDNFFADLEQVKQEWGAFSSPARKTERVAYYINNYQDLDTKVFDKINAQFSGGKSSENATCQTALPFCTDNGEYHFYPGVNSGSPCGSTTTASCGEPYDDCPSSPAATDSYNDHYDGIATAPNPAFYFMRISEPGNLRIHILGYETDGTNLDVDFVCWGPFTSMDDVCNLSCSNMIDASYSYTNDETCYIDNAQTGQYYMLLITNYGNADGEFTFSNIGTGSTDCAIMEPGVSSNSPICIGETLELKAVDYSGADSFLWEGPNGWTSTLQNPTRPNATMSMAGTYTCTITKNGESAVSELEVVVLQQPIASFTSSAQIVCAGETVTFNNTSTTTPSGGTLTEYLWEFGDGTTSTTQNATHSFAQSGAFTVKLTVGNGACDDYSTKTIIVEGDKTREEYVESCNPFTWYGQTYTASGDYQHTIDNEQGCDSLIILHLTINAAEEAETTEIACDSFTWIDGNTYTASGDYTFETTNEHGCPLIETLHLTINNSGSSEETQSSCDEYTWYGNTYTESGDYTYETTTAEGCQKIETLHLTIGHTEYSEETITSCDSYDWNGMTLTESNTYTYETTTAIGCPRHEKIYLTINHSDESAEEASSCDSYTWHGTTYTIPGSYEYHTLTTQGCDSTITLNLTLEYSETIETAMVACDSYTWHDNVYTQSDSYSYQAESTTGDCPHTEILNLTIVETPDIDIDGTRWPVSGSETSYSSYFYSVVPNNSSIEFDSVVWQFDNEGWFLIPDEDGMNAEMRIFSWQQDSIPLTATAYNQCGSMTITIWIHPSYYGISEDNADNISIIPNPNMGNMDIKIYNATNDSEVKVFDIIGNLIDRFVISRGTSTYHYDMSGKAAGMYNFVITNDSRSRIERVIVEK